MFDYLLDESQKKFLDEVRDFVNWVPREMILDMDADRIKFPKAFPAIPADPVTEPIFWHLEKMSAVFRDRC